MTFNPFDPAQLEDPFADLSRLRRDAPVTEPVPGIHFVARYHDVVTVLKGHEQFPQAGHTPLAVRDPEDLGLGELDPPRHSAVRKVLLTALGTTKVKAAAPGIDALARQLIAGFAGERQIDLMDRFAKPFPTMVVAQMIGVPEEDSPRFRRWADLQVASLDQTQATPAEDYRPEEFNVYLYELVAQHREARDRPDDLVTRMIEFCDTEVGPLTDREIVAQLNNVIVGGTETTTHLIGNLFYELARRPDVYQRLRDDRSLVPSAIEESLRLSAPVQFLFRRCPHDATFGEATVPAGSTVAISLLSANRDESRFPAPDTFDVDRGSSVHDHVAFGLGIHFCIGAQLARLEVRLATEAMLDTFVRIASAPGAS